MISWALLPFVAVALILPFQLHVTFAFRGLASTSFDAIPKTIKPHCDALLKIFRL